MAMDEDKLDELRKEVGSEELVQTLEQIIEQKVEERIRQKENQKIQEQQKKEEIDRRNFMKKIGAGALGLGAASLIPSASALDIKDSQGLTVHQDSTEHLDVSSSAVNVLNTVLQEQGNRVATRSWANSNLAGSNHLHDSQYVKLSGDTMSGYLSTGGNNLYTDGGAISTNAGNLRLDSGDQGIYIHDGTGNFNIKSGIEGGSNTITKGSGGSEIELEEYGRVEIKVDSSTSSGGTVDADTKMVIDHGSVNVTQGTLEENGNRVATQSSLNESIRSHHYVMNVNSI